MKQYLDLLREVRNEGAQKNDRTGTGTVSLFGRQMRFNLAEGFPLVTTKKVHLRSIIHELLWFLQGNTNIQYLKDNNVSIWDEWADEDGDLGPVYGKQWREWVDWRTVLSTDTEQRDMLTKLGYHHVDSADTLVQHEDLEFWARESDQISKVIEQLRNDPDSRRIIVSAWNVGELDQMALAPCHSFFQFYTRELSFLERETWTAENMREKYDGQRWALESIPFNPETLDAIKLKDFNEWGVPTRILSCQLYQRSADMFLGVPFNIASYALLIHMVAQQVNMAVGDFVWTGGDVHLYNNHFQQADLQLTREPHPLPKLVIKRKPDSIFDYKFEDFEVQGYTSHDPIKAPVAI